MSSVGRLLITCPDRSGIVAAISTFFQNHGANITALDQHSTDPEGGRFFIRLEFQTPNLDVSTQGLERAFETVVAERFDMSWTISYSSNLKRVAVMVSKYDHALLEVLWRWRRGDWPADICMVISNHDDMRDEVASFGIPYHHIPVSKSTKAEAEAQALTLLREAEVDVIILARYMQILTHEFVSNFPCRIINIHHSFLPAFVGADPYRQAYERGVKIIGATAHYVTAELDAGPIVTQDVASISHRQSVADLKRLGRQLERTVLARAVHLHIEDRVIVDGNKTVVFE